ncbi:MAG: hypothetical protein IPH45_20650 [Bacteroidales bacterium]|nr:hypothetical protein [Bacteroidales bacterium]
MKAFFLLVTLFACNLAFSQHIQFNWQGCFYQSGYELNSYEPSIVSTGDGYMILSLVETGNIIQPGDMMETDIRLVKIDSIGNFLWEKYFEARIMKMQKTFVLLIVETIIFLVVPAPLMVVQLYHPIYQMAVCGLLK